MSFDLVFWKRGPKTKTAMLRETYAALCEGNTHISMEHFPIEQLMNDIKDKLGDWNDENSKYALEVSDVRGEDGEAVFVHCAFSSAEEVTKICIDLALKYDIMLYDPQRVAVWNNKRPPKLTK